MTRPKQQGEDYVRPKQRQSQNNVNKKRYKKCDKCSKRDAFLVLARPPAPANLLSFVFCISGEKRSRQRKIKKEEAASAVAAAEKRTCRDKVAMEKLKAIKSAEEKGKLPTECACQYKKTKRYERHALFCARLFATTIIIYLLPRVLIICS